MPHGFGPGNWGMRDETETAGGEMALRRGRHTIGHPKGESLVGGVTMTVIESRAKLGGRGPGITDQGG